MRPVTFVAAWAGGMRVESVSCLRERAVITRSSGRTDLNLMDLSVDPPSAEALHIQALAGDAVSSEDLRRPDPDEIGHLHSLRN